MAWIELHQAVWTHRKTFELAGLLDLDETYAAAHVIRLWSWALDNAPAGDVRGMSARVIAFGAGWRGDSDLFVRALVESGWLDEDMQIHDWQEYAGRLIERRLQDAERKRALRARPQDVHRTASAVRRTVPNRTGPDPTQPESTPQPPPCEEGERPKDDEGDGEPTVEDTALLVSAKERLRADLKGPNWERFIAPLEAIGRGGNGGLLVRAPPGATKFRRHIAAALAAVGDSSGFQVGLVE